MLNIIGVPSILGCNRPGCDEAPSMIRNLGLYEALAQIDYKDFGDIESDYTAEEIKQNPKNLNKVIQIVNNTFNFLISNVNKQDKILCIGGDHSVAMGSIFYSAHHNADLGLLWIDAHADSNSPQSSSTGNIHGMPLSTVLGDSLFNEFEGMKSIDKENVVLLGIKDVDPKEWEYLKDNNIKFYTMEDIVERGIGEIYKEIEFIFRGRSVHMSLDIDGLDHDIAPGTGIINKGGINYREIKYIINKIKNLDIVGMDLVEVNPLFDIENKTIDLSIEIISDLFGGTWTPYSKYLKEISVQ